MAEWRSIGVSLSKEEIKELDAIAKKYQVTRGQVMRFFLMYGVSLVKSGKLDLKDFLETERKLKPPK